MTKPGLKVISKDITDWKKYLSTDSNDKISSLFIENVDTGRPLGDKAFIEKIEAIVGRTLKRKKPGPRRKGN